ncbi:siderophore-interacting protein [bacterium]|nr:siderophore-interacting protein [bacterium]
MHQQTWLITNNPDTDMINALKSLPLSEQQPIVFMALEAGLVRKAKTILTDELAIPRSQIVASGYWKKGLDSEAYKLKRQHAAAKNS